MESRPKICILLIVMIFLSCSDSTSPDTKTNYLFKATFTNDWLDPEAGPAIIFISDSSGNILSEKIWSGNASFEMFPDSNLAESIVTSLKDIKHISVTTVIAGNITTNLHIPIGSSWTFKGYPSPNYNNPSDSVSLDFENFPEHMGYIISSKWNSRLSSSGNLGFSLPIKYYLYETPMDVYLKLNTTNNDVRYYWLNDVVSGNRQEDLSNMNLASSKNIELPDNNGYRKYLYGISETGQRYEGQYRLDYGREYMSTNSITVYYPQDSFNDYRTSITLIDELGRTEWYNSVYGAIPGIFSKINASFEYVSTQVDNFEISITGNYIQTASIWQYDDYSFTWVVYAGENINKYKLPMLPNSVKTFFNIDRTGFELWLSDIMDYPELSSYSEVLDILFNSDNYFYDVVNESRRYTKYKPGSSLSKSGQTDEIRENLYREPFINF